MRALLSRLLLVLALAFFGAHDKSGPTVPSIGPVAEHEAAFAPAILTAQSHLLRAQSPDVDTPPLILSAPGRRALIETAAARISWDQHQSFVPSAIHIQPPVRGPPLV
ncbi:hypothetical protein P775_04915 [Puniceibacterium antarcticum]|uniref:Uncharacterized protein n=1 Tax=Puniceibacterium antarcticum TaxID=1206336 RepID=A0A2G8RIL3_9RHOB|nr:hypothetical protein P775_04915 [Puniceibacterium antarcticum]